MNERGKRDVKTQAEHAAAECMPFHSHNLKWSEGGKMKHNKNGKC